MIGRQVLRNFYGGGGAGGMTTGSSFAVTIGEPSSCNVGAGGVGNGVAGNATDRFGGGGGGFGGNSAIKGAGDGGNGVVVVRYTSGSDLATGGWHHYSTVGGDKVHTFSAGGNAGTSGYYTTAAKVLAAGALVELVLMQFHANGGGGGGVGLSNNFEN